MSATDDTLEQSPSHTSKTSTSTSTSTAAYLAYPVRYAVSSALRRLSNGSSSRSPSRKRGRDRAAKPKAGTSPAMPSKAYASLINLDDSEEESAAAEGDVADDDDFGPLPPPPPVAASRGVSYSPSPRPTPPPFQPPPLTPLSLDGLQGDSGAAQILSRLIAEEIRLLLPPRLQLVDAWRLLFNLEHDGSSLATLYDRCDDYKGRRGGFVLVVRDASGSVFGAYLSDPPAPSQGHYYGNGECFLWRSAVISSLPTLASLPPPPSADTTHATRMTTLGSPKTASAIPLDVTSRPGTSTPERIRFKAFPYSGINDYMIFCEHGFLSVGGGDGHYGLWLDSALENGVSSRCLTFGNEPLSEDGTKFEVIGVEMWYVGA